MPLFQKDQYSASQQWHTSLSRDQVETRLQEAVRRMGGRVTSVSESELSADFGSSSALRLLGVAVDLDRLPLSMTVNWQDVQQGAVVNLAANSTEGRYLFRTKALGNYYRAAFDAKAQALKDAVTS